MPDSHHAPPLSAQGMSLPEWIATGLEEWSNCVLEAAMPLDLREKLLQLHVAKSQGAVLLSCCQDKFTPEKACRERLPLLAGHGEEQPIRHRSVINKSNQ